MDRMTRIALVSGGALFAGFFCQTRSEAFTYEDLQALIGSLHATRIAQVVEALPEELRSSYTLMESSQSLQGATPAAPRALLFGSDAKLLIAFNGDPRLSGYGDLEVIQFREVSREFEFHRVSFPAETGQSGEVSFSPKNPKLCAACHTRGYRPNWEQYNHWPGAYGEHDDYPATTELASLDEFLSQGMLHGRYQALRRLSGSEASPYETRERGRLRFRPNFRLMAYLSAYEADRVAARLESQPGFTRFWYLFALSRLDCDARAIDPAKELIRLFGPHGADPLGPWKAPEVHNLYAFVIRDLGMTPRDWTTSFADPNTDPRDPYFFATGLPKGQGTVTELSDLVLSRLWQDLLPAHPELAPFTQPDHWVVGRFAADPLDHSLASALDAGIRLFDYQKMKAACPTLIKGYLAAVRA